MDIGIGRTEFFGRIFISTVLVHQKYFTVLNSISRTVSSKPLSIPLGSFRIFPKIRGDIRCSRFATGVNDTGGKCKKSSIIKVLII
jgi:hypothetical protein